MRNSRALACFGGLALVASFFMPAVPRCNSPVVPAEEAWDVVTLQSSSDPAEILAGFMLYCLTYAFGLLTVFATLRGGGPRRRGERTLGISISVLFGVTISALSIFLVADLLINRSAANLTEILVACAMVGVSLAYWLRSLRLGPAGLLCARWYMALYCVLWFGLWFVNSDTYYGLKISLAGSILILMGTAGEAKVRSHQTLPVTLWRLLRCRIDLYDLDQPRCFGCGYLLIGLETTVCPECGRGFVWEDYGLRAGPAIRSEHEPMKSTAKAMREDRGA